MNKPLNKQQGAWLVTGVLLRGVGLLWVVSLMLAGGAEVISLLLNLCVSDKCTEHTIGKPQGSKKQNVLYLLFIYLYTFCQGIPPTRS